MNPTEQQTRNLLKAIESVTNCPRHGDNIFKHTDTTGVSRIVVERLHPLLWWLMPCRCYTGGRL